MSRRSIAVEPATRPAMHDALRDAVVAGGGTVDTDGRARGLVWADPTAADRFPSVARDLPHLEWVQLPYAGVEPFLDHLSHDYRWTCGKGVYAPPVAEHALGLALAGLRHIHRYAPASSWGPPAGTNLIGGEVAIIGGGGIAESLIALLAPFGCDITVVRRRPLGIDGAARVLGPDRLHEALGDAVAVFVAAAATPQTRGLVDGAALAAMRGDAWLVNVARGSLVDTDALVTALGSGAIGGAALDVTDPEPLPDDHPLWFLEHCIITPHVGNTPEMGLPLLCARVRDNVARFIAGDDLIGPVDVDAGY